MEPLVSILIPTYNRSHLIKRTISSALSQTYQNIELIISDNSENNLTQKVITDINCSKIKYMKNEQNIGPILNWRKSLEHSNGKYCLILPDDDYLLNPFYIEDGVKLLSKSKCKLLIANSIISYESGYQSKIGTTDLRYHVVNTDLQLPKVVKGLDFFNKFWKLNYQIPSIVNIFDKKLALKIDAFNNNDILYSDIECWLKMFLHTDVCFYKVPSIHYSFHGGNILFNMTQEEIIKNSLFITNVAKYWSEINSIEEQSDDYNEIVQNFVIKYLLFAYKIETNRVNKSTIQEVCKINRVKYNNVINRLRKGKTKQRLKELLIQIKDSNAVRGFFRG